MDISWGIRNTENGMAKTEINLSTERTGRSKAPAAPFPVRVGMAAFSV